MSSLEDRYFEALGVAGNDPQRNEKLQGALNLALDIRKMEVELYWKRATYLWAFEAIAFASIGLLVKNGGIPNLALICIPAALGCVTSLAGYLTAKGSKFWQESWESHVDMLETAVGVRLTQVIITSRSLQHSVTRVNEYLLLLMAAGWFVVLAYAALPELRDAAALVESVYWRLGSIAAVVVVCVLLYWRTKSRIGGSAFVPGENDWRPAQRRNVVKGRHIIWRNRPEPPAAP